MEQTLECLYLEHSDRIYRYIYFQVRQKEVAEDITQETFYKAFKNFHTFKKQASVSTWLLRIARNATYDYFRRKRLIQFFSLGKEGEIDSKSFTPEKEFLKKDKTIQLYKALDLLKKDYRDVLILRKLNENTIKETAYILGWSEAKVKSTMQRAFAALKKKCIEWREALMNEFDNEFQRMRDISRTYREKMDSLSKINKRRKKKKFNILPAIVLCSAVAVASILFMTFNNSMPLKKAATITDIDTVQDIPFVETIEPHMFVLEYLSDSMDWGNHDYSSHEIVVDPKVYEGEDIKRGDVILFENEEGHAIVSRIVAVPGEKMHIIEGQIFINGKKLDVFYGKAHRIGMEREEYNDAVKGTGNFLPASFDADMDAIVLNEGQYFVAGDDCLRGIRTVLNEESIAGKVLGYARE